MINNLNREEAWTEIFKKFPIIDKVDESGYYDIGADDIKFFKEPRLMCKVDYREGMPTIMAENGLSILAINNGLYRIARNSPFININELNTKSVTDIPPPDLITLNHINPSSESAALDIAYATGILDKVFNEPSRLTIRGRKRCDLDFNIGRISYPVRGVQVEVDGGYESDLGIHLIEAKIGSTSNINIRQLLYPHRYWHNFSNLRKKVSSYVFLYQEGIYRFIPFHAEGDCYTVDHSGEKLFKLSEKIPSINLMTISPQVGVTKGFVPFPQADKLEKVIAILIKITESESTPKEDLFLMFDLVPRQIDYYTNAVLWLGLIEYNNKTQEFKPTERGLEISKKSYTTQIAEVAKIILTNSVFNFALHNPHKAVPNPIRINNGLTTESTYNRRMMTVFSWLNHIKKILETK